MPIIGHPVAPRLITRQIVRRFMRDFPGPVRDTGVMNILLDNVEFSDADIEPAITMAIGWYNAMTPVTWFTPDRLPLVVLLYGTVSHLMLSEGIRQVRNMVTVQDGNVQPIGIDDKEAVYMRWAQWFRAEFEKYARNIKTEWNMNQAYGGMSSGYLVVPAWRA